MTQRLPWVTWMFLLLLVQSGVALSQTIVESLPGFSGDLPFKLETGYIGVGELDDVQLFYYFVESERNPRRDPLMLWLTGGPGCSAFSGLVYEIGPLTYNYTDFYAALPTLTLNPYSWTKLANIIFLDQPVGTGFSYATTAEAYTMNDTTSTAQTYEFLQKWLIKHPSFQANPLYISGDSYSGITVPIITLEVSNGNEEGRFPQMNLQGYLLGNPVTLEASDLNSRVPFAHQMALISDELYESAKRSCGGKYLVVDPNNTECSSDLEVINECLERVCNPNILEPQCTKISPKPKDMKWKSDGLPQDPIDFLVSPTDGEEPWCRNYNYLLSYSWANNKQVQKALGIREGSIKSWVRCNYSLSYTYNVDNVVDIHGNLSALGYQALIYSGDHDKVIPHVGTEQWIKSLNLTVYSDWLPWFVDGQVAGYTVQYESSPYNYFTYATVKGAGHTAPEYKPKECLAMLDRWLARYHL